MLIETARRAEAAAREMLALVREGSAPCAEMREMLDVSKTTVALMSAAQTSAATSIARRERHGDGGTQVLADTVGLSTRDAHGQVRTAQTIETVPSVRAAVEDGRVSMANARRLAEAIDKTSVEAVESGGELLAKAESMRPEQFTREARRWAADHQDDGGESAYRRQRAKRCVRVWNGDDGMVHLHGKFDPVAGQRIGNRLRAEAARMHYADKKHAKSGGADRRSFDHCMADALDNLTSSTATGNRKPFADICVVAHVDDDTGALIAELPDGVRLPQAVLEQLACNAKVCGAIYDRKGKPIWRTQARRTVTEAQWQLLIARYGGCFHCGANPAICQGHHIEPASQGGPTKLDNLVPACWSCHHRIHHDGWQVHKSPDGNHTLHPPDRIHYGPAHAPGNHTLRAPDCVSHGPAAAPEEPSLFRSGTGDRPVGASPPGFGRPGNAEPSVRAGPAAARLALRNARASSTKPAGSGW